MAPWWFSIKNKLKAFTELELPLLIDKGFVSKALGVTNTCNGVTKYCSGEKLDSSSFSEKKQALAGIWTRDLCLTKAQ
jgi:hypothetical protein